ncbi:MAG: hypothetical protein H7305_03795 [Gemmatimonadaceae bacterium]|nr:hypothetical protein [Gemmatimonadaceae bacterium]
MYTEDADLSTTFSMVGERPCLSLYQTTHRSHPENVQDPIRFRNLVKSLQTSLEAEYPADVIVPLLKPFHALADDSSFWNGTRDGLAVLGSKDSFRVFRLQRPVADQAIVADSFHIKPFMRVRQAADQFFVLGINRNTFRLYKGNPDVLDEIQPDASIPQTMTAALGNELTGKEQTVASYGGVGHGHTAMHHGLGGLEVEVAIDDERFFRVVDKAILAHYSRPTGLPLILATLPAHRELFHRISHNPFLMPTGIDHYTDTMSLDELRACAWRELAPQIEERITSLIEEYGTARSHDLGDDDLPMVATAIASGRVATLLVEADREIPGRFDVSTGTVQYADLASPRADDLLDDMAESAVKMGGTVVIVPSAQMPSTTGIAAIYRFSVSP